MPEPSQTIASTGLRFTILSLRTKAARLPRLRSGTNCTVLTRRDAAHAVAIASTPLRCAVVISTISGTRALIPSSRSQSSS